MPINCNGIYAGDLMAYAVNTSQGDEQKPPRCCKNNPKPCECFENSCGRCSEPYYEELSVPTSNSGEANVCCESKDSDAIVLECSGTYFVWYRACVPQNGCAALTLSGKLLPQTAVRACGNSGTESFVSDASVIEACKGQILRLNVSGSSAACGCGQTNPIKLVAVKIS